MFKIKPDVFTAINELVGGGIAGHGDGTQMSYFGKTPPSKSKIDAKLVELISAWDVQEYARKREPVYPALVDQLDMQYWDQVNGTTTWKDAIAKVKSDFPKGGE